MCKFINLYTDIQLNEGIYPLIYFPLFLIRRLLFCLLPILLTTHPTFQLQLLLFSSKLNLILYTTLHPHHPHHRHTLELLNESLTVVLIYHMICFTDLVLDPIGKFYMGYSYVGVAGLVVLVNLVGVAVG